jgi:hypothetical protein
MFCLLLIFIFPSISNAQTETKNERKGEFYFSWGYNTEWYTASTVYVSQPGLNHDYALESVKAHDRRGWDGDFFHEALTIPQYNYRIGYFFNKKKGLAIEINFDHTKYIIADGQQVHVTGTIDGKTVDYNIDFRESNGFFYFLNNGANFFLFNLVKRVNVIKGNPEKGKFKLDFLAKAGVGPVVPHVANSFFGYPNTPHFQLGGWNTGVEAALRATVFRYAFIEYANKLDYARYSGLKIYEGTVHQAFGTYEMILNLGITFPIKQKP